MIYFRLMLISFLLFQNTFAQNPNPKGDFFPPLDIPLYLSGNFGELRSDHFHSGLDFKTQGVTGKKVYSIEVGYISRIKIQTQGYGNSIYITHPGGLTSVYGHLESFSDPVKKYIQDYQYQKKTHTLDIYPDKELFKIEKGEVIASSGNTGSSGGPHLHFEIRGTSSQHPINPLFYNFPIKDNLPPQLFNLYVYPIEESTPGTYATPKIIPLIKSNKAYKLNSGDTITLTGITGFGLEAADFLNEISNQCGVYSIQMFVNENPVYHFRMDEFSFPESGYINAHIDFRAKIERNRKVHLLYRKPNNRLSLYPLLENEGLVASNPGEISHLNIRVTDAYGNMSSLEFYVKGLMPAFFDNKPASADNKLFKWNAPNYFENAQVMLSIPVNSLYEDILFTYSRSDVGYQSIYPYTHYLGDAYTPLHKPAELSFSGDLIPESLRSKVVIALLNGEINPSCLFSMWKGDRVSARINKLGKYTLVVDTIAPVIIPANIKSGAIMNSQSSIRFTVKDNLSGVYEYQGYIDNSWVLFEYDPKNELIVYTFDRERLKSGVEHQLELYVKDAVGNQKIYHTKFIW